MFANVQAIENGSNISSGKLCKYFFTQMVVTILILVVFESYTRDPAYIRVEHFIIWECLILILDLLFFLCRSNGKITFENFNRQSIPSMDCQDKFTAFLAILLYFVHCIWLFYGNYLYFTLPYEPVPSEPDLSDVTW
jgi:hypothetical protein